MSTAEGLRDLFARYSAAVDDARYDDIADAFCLDGSFTPGSQGAQPVRTRAGVRAYMQERLSAQTDMRRHVITNVRVVSQEQDAVSGAGYLTLMVTDNGATTARVTGTYEGDAVREQDGRWRWRALRLRLDGPL